MLRAILALALLLSIAGFAVLARDSEAQAPLTYRVTVPFVASGEAPPSTTLPPRRTPPPDGPGYCGPSTAGTPFPPNAIFGLLTIGGQPAPAETLVTLTFDGLPGPSEYTREAGGYRVLYAAGGQGHVPRCINEVGSEMGILINGVLTDARIKVGGPEVGGAGIAFRFDIALP